MSTDVSADLTPSTTEDATVDEEIVEEEVRDAYAPHLTVADGFRFGCGLILVSLAFVFLLLIGGAVAVLLAVLLNIPLPFVTP